MSFMKGFGAAFSDNFDREQRVKAQEKDDQFKMTYAEFVKKREARDEQKKSDTKLANQAKALVEGVDGVPQEAYSKVYNWLQSGLDDQEISRRLQSGKFEVKQKAGEKVVEETPEVKPVDQQMAGGGLGGATVPPQDAERGFPQEDQGFLGKIGLGNLLGNSREKNQNSAYEKIASASGMSVDEVSSMVGSNVTPSTVDDSNVSFTPGAPERKPDEFANSNEAAIELAQAKTSGDPQRIFIAQERYDAIRANKIAEAEDEAKSRGITLDGTPVTVWRDGKYATNARVKIVNTPDGQQYVDMITGKPIDGTPVPIGEDEQKLIGTAAASVREPLQKLNTRASNLRGAIGSYKIMSDIVKKTDGAVLAGWTSSVARGATQVATEAVQASKQISNLAQTEGGELPEGGEAYLEDLQNKLLAEGGNDLGTQSALFELQKAMLAYRLASSMGQEGRSLAEPERKLFTEMASGGVTPDRFYKGMSDLLVPATKVIDSEGERLIQTDPSVGTLRETYGYVPKQLEYQPIQLDLEVSKDPEISTAWKELTESTGKKSNFPTIPEGGSPQSVPQSADIPVMNSPEEAMKLPSGTVFMTPDGKRKVRP